MYPRCSHLCGHRAPQGRPDPHLTWIHPLHIPNRHKVCINFVFQSVFPRKTQNQSFMCSGRQPRQAGKLPYFSPTFLSLTFCSSREPGRTPQEPCLNRGRTCTACRADLRCPRPCCLGGARLGRRSLSLTPETEVSLLWDDPRAT